MAGMRTEVVFEYNYDTTTTTTTTTSNYTNNNGSNNKCSWTTNKIEDY